MKTFEDFGITNLRGSGVERRSTCPQCSSSRKNKKATCLDVNMDKGVWNCHHCGWKGTLKSGSDSSSNPYLWVKKTYTKPVFVERSPENKMLDWFLSRGITAEVVTRNKIYRDEIYMPQVEDHVPAICYPFFRKGEAVNMKYRDKDKHFRGVGGAERVFYGLDDIDDITFIVEGEMDKLSLEVAGFKNCISVPDGAPAPDAKDYSSKFEFLENCKEELSKVVCFVIAVDSDKPGQVLEEELARRLGKDKCLRVPGWPEGCKDANDVLMKHGVEVLKDRLSTLHDFPIKGVMKVSSFRDKIEKLYDSGIEPGINPGWPEMAQHYTVKGGYMTIVTGIPQHGKSEWLDALLVNLAKNQGWKFAFYSPENHPVETHASKLIEKYIGKGFDRNYLGFMDVKERNEGIEWLDNHFSFLGGDENALSLEGVLEKAEQLIFQEGINGLVLDPWNELDHARPSNLSETEYISKCLTRIRYFARTTGIHVWIVAHPTKLQKINGKQPVPTPYDISGSAHWFNKSDNCITVWRDIQKPGSPTHIYTQKIKLKGTGKLGRVLMDYNLRTGVYRESQCQKLAEDEA